MTWCWHWRSIALTYSLKDETSVIETVAGNIKCCNSLKDWERVPLDRNSHYLFIYLCSWKVIYDSETSPGPSASWTELGTEGTMKINLFQSFIVLLSSMYYWANSPQMRQIEASLTLWPSTIAWRLTWFRHVFSSVSTGVTRRWFLWLGGFPDLHTRGKGCASPWTSPGTVVQTQNTQSLFSCGDPKTSFPGGLGRASSSCVSAHLASPPLHPTPIRWSKSLSYSRPEGGLFSGETVQEFGTQLLTLTLNEEETATYTQNARNSAGNLAWTRQSMDARVGGKAGWLFLKTDQSVNSQL